MSALATNKKKSSIKESSRYNLESSKKPQKSEKRHILIRSTAMVRQSSAKDEHGDTIPDTAIYTDQQHCPLMKNVFFDTLVANIFHNKHVCKSLVRERLKAACIVNGMSVLESAIWVTSYLEKKMNYLDENTKHKVGIGQSKLHYEHKYIIEKILKIIKNIIDEEVELFALDAEENAEAEEPLTLAATVQAAAVEKKSGPRNYRDSAKLIF
jgi:hypothetical protein